VLPGSRGMTHAFCSACRGGQFVANDDYDDDAGVYEDGFEHVSGLEVDISRLGLEDGNSSSSSSLSLAPVPRGRGRSSGGQSKTSGMMKI
jgi:hypothetical protein